MPFASTYEPCRLEFPFNKLTYDKYEIVSKLVDQFRSSSNKDDLYKLCNRSFTHNALLRVSLWLDLPTYTLPIHPDKGYKIFTLQIYIPHSDENLGTDIYDQDKQFHSRIKFEKNNGYCFMPSRVDPISWHAYTQPIKAMRQTVVVNLFDKEQYIREKKGRDEDWFSM